MLNPIAFVIFSVALIFSGYSTFTTDVLRIETPIFSQRFGFFQTCLGDGTSASSSLVSSPPVLKATGLEYCQDFPGKCSLTLPSNGGAVKLSFCQNWLVARYLQISAFIVGLVTFLLFILSSQLPFFIPFLLFSSTIFAVLEIMNTQVIQNLKGDQLFTLGGVYGFSFTSIGISWGLTALSLILVAANLGIQRFKSRGGEYTPIPPIVE